MFEYPDKYNFNIRLQIVCGGKVTQMDELFIVC